MAGLYAPLPTLRSRPRGRLRTDRGRRGLLLLHRSGLCRVEVPVARHLPHRSRRAAFLHRALVEGQTPSTRGFCPCCWRRLATSVTCESRLRVRCMRRRLPSLRPAAFPPLSPQPISWPCSRLHRYCAAVRLLVCSPTASSPRLPVAFRIAYATRPRRGLPGSDALLLNVMWP